MKLRNKRTGEIRDCQLMADGFIVINSLKDLEEWEDYQEPKGYWHINSLGEVEKLAIDDRLTDAEKSFILDSHLEIGNYFETREEAEKAVERLKAWKRLKDKGFRLDGHCCYDTDGEKYPHILFSYPNFDDLFDDSETVADLDLLFGGEC